MSVLLYELLIYIYIYMYVYIYGHRHRQACRYIFIYLSTCSCNILHGHVEEQVADLQPFECQSCHIICRRLVALCSMASGSPSDTDRLAAKRSLETPADRAAKCRKFGERRVPLEQLGFLPSNRGGLGVVGRPPFFVGGIWFLFCFLLSLFFLLFSLHFNIFSMWNEIGL